MFDPMSEIHKRVTINPDTQCWEWNKSLTSAGYGQFSKEGRYWTAHRYSYIHTNGELQTGEIVRHLCHSTKCCNPKHLLKGTHKDNWQDSKTNHINAQKILRKQWIVGGMVYATFREAVKCSGISGSSLNKFTDKETRVFDIEAYRKACAVAGWVPKV